VPAVNVSARTVAKVILTAIFVVGGLYLLWLIRGVIGQLFISIFLAIALGPSVDFFQRRLRARRGIAILMTYISLLLAIAGIGLLVIPPIVDQTNKFVINVPEYIDQLNHNKTIRRYDDKYDITPKLKEQARKLPSHFGDAASALQSIAVGLFNAIITVVTVLVMTFFLLLDGKRAFEWGIRELGPARGPRARVIAEEVYRSVGGYVAGNLAISAIAGLSTYVVLILIDVPFAVPLAVLMAFLDLVPLVGASIAGGVIAIVAAIDGFPTELIIWVVFLIVYQQIENNLLQPLIYRRTVALHPLLVIVAILVGAALLGIVGALLAIPIAGAIQIVIRDWWTVRKSRAPLLADDGEGVVLSP
jgi:predicted PurR-regulated permease PerM